MRVTPVAFIDWYTDRCARLPAQAMLPPSMSYWRPDMEQEMQAEAPPVPEPGKGLHVDYYA